MDWDCLDLKNLNERRLHDWPSDSFILAPISKDSVMSASTSRNVYYGSGMLSASIPTKSMRDGDIVNFNGRTSEQLCVLNTEMKFLFKFGRVS